MKLVTQAYDELKFKQVLKHGFFEMQALKDNYRVAKKGEASKKLLLQFIEAQLIILNPICPHFAEHCWQTYVKPTYEALGMKKCEALLIN